MGIFGSSEENIEQKAIESNGQVNNNIIIQEAKDVHEQLKLNERLLNMSYIICAIEILKLAMYMYCKFTKKIKKKYDKTNNNTA